MSFAPGTGIFSTTPGLEERAKAMYENGKSTRLIAETLSEEFNIILSRNAVIGQMRRQKWKVKEGVELEAIDGTNYRMGRVTGPAPVKNKVTVPKNNRGVKPKLKLKPKLKPKPRQEPTPEQLTAPSLNLTLMELPDDGCHHIEGEPPLYCGLKVVAKGASYCPRHTKVMSGGLPKRKPATDPLFIKRSSTGAWR